MLFLFFSPLDIEVGFEQRRVEHDEAQKPFCAYLQKSRPTQQNLTVLIRISSSAAEDAATFDLDFRLPRSDNITLIVPADSRRVQICYHILEDLIPESQEIFSLVVSHNEGPNFECDDGGDDSHDPGYDCNPTLEVVINDNDGEPLLFRCVIV